MAGDTDYAAVIEKVFRDRHEKGATEVPFDRDDLLAAAAAHGVVIKNIGDVIYSFKYRQPLPASIVGTQPRGREWVIEGAGRARYVFRLSRINRIVPNPSLRVVKVPDATPEIISAYALTDEQALLAKVRYNRLIDVFVGATTYSLQSHFRTTVKGVGQIEIDEVYVGIDRHGRQWIFPVQAKGGSDQIGVVQIKQDILCCAERFPRLICRPIAAQFMSGDEIALFELTLAGDQIQIVDERHYRLARAGEISDADLADYRKRSD